MLKFIVPNPPKHEIVLVDNYNEKICHFFEYQDYLTDIVNLRIDERFIDCKTSTFYQLKIDGHDLIVVSCYGVSDSQEKMIQNANYPYIRLPKTDDAQESWEYMQDSERRVKCVSKFSKNETNGKISERTLHILRDIEYICLEDKGGFVVEEIYAEGIGLIKRSETTY